MTPAEQKILKRRSQLLELKRKGYTDEFIKFAFFANDPTANIDADLAQYNDLTGQGSQPVEVGGRQFEVNTLTDAKNYQEMKTAETQQAKMKVTARDELQKKLTTLQEISQDSEGISAAVGPNPLARPFTPVSGAKQRVANKLESILSTDTLDALINAKAEGATFGALSDAELALLRASAGVLAQSAVKDDKGKIVGFDMAEEDFKKELANLQSTTQKAFTSLTTEPGQPGQATQGQPKVQDPAKVQAWLDANPNDPRAEQVRKLIQSQNLGGSPAPVSSAAPEEPKGFLSTVGSELAQAPGKFMDRMSSASQSLASEGKVPSLFGRGGLRAAGVIGGTIGDAFVSMTKIGFSALKDEQQQALKATADAAINSETGKAAIQALQAGSEQWNQFKSENPTVAKDIEDAANVISAIPSGFGLRGTARLAADAADLAKRGTKATARAVTGVTAADTIAAEATDTAFRAIKPALKVGRDKKNVKAVVQSAMQAVSDSGISPTNLREFADGLAQTKRTVWSNIEQAIGQGKELKVDMQSISDELLKMSQSRTLSMADRTAASRISELAQNLIADGKSISVPDAEALKEYINSELRGTFGKFTQSAAEVNAKKLVTAKIGEQLDKLLSSVPGEFSAMKKTYGALRQTEEDVLKRIIVFERQNPEGLIDSFSKISGIGNIMKGVAGTVTGGAIGGPSDILRGAAELTVGKIQKAANDSDLLIKKAFETMKKSNGSFEPRSTLLKKLMGKGGMSIQDVSKDVTKQVQYNVSGEWKSVTQLAKEYMAKTAATEEQAFQWAKSKVEGLKGRVDIKR